MKTILTILCAILFIVVEIAMVQTAYDIGYEEGLRAKVEKVAKKLLDLGYRPDDES